MKSTLKILAYAGTGIVIGSIAGRYIKSERKQIGRIIRNLLNEDRYIPGLKVDGDKEEELELYFI